MANHFFVLGQIVINLFHKTQHRKSETTKRIYPEMVKAENEFLSSDLLLLY